MPVQGNLATMSLTEILQWLGNAGKTGALSIERNKVVKRILVREGRIMACSSQEPSDMLGHFLVSRGRISEETLRKALSVQETDKTHLGGILVGMGALSDDELRRSLEDKSQETIFGLFEWEDAEFRFDEGSVDDANIYAVNMRVEDILLRGAQRWDEIQRIRTVFNDPGIVLARTARVPPAEVFRNRMARRIFESINGDRTVADILLHAHGSEYLVTKFLFELHRAGCCEIAGVRAVERPPAPPPRPAPPAPAQQARPVAVAGPPASAVAADGGDLEVARRLLNRGEFEGALEILDRAYKAQPGDEALRRILAEAEATFIEKAYRHYLPPGKIVTLARPVEELATERLSPPEFFLLSRIDGTWDVRSIIQITPLREVDVLRTLKRMRENGVILLKDSDQAATA
jgi:hypothetical protein